MELKHMGNPNIVIALSGNKADLTGMREVEFKVCPVSDTCMSTVCV